MQKYPLWKPFLILAVLAVCIYCILPLREKLKPGLDLAGGTILVYQVDIPSGRNADETINETIDILRRRIDPAGLRSLIWRPQAGGRLEIQMPMASPEASRLRDQYLADAQGLTDRNLPEDTVMSALRLPTGEQHGEFAKLAGGNEQRMAAFDELIKTHAELEATRKPYEELSQKLKELQATKPPATMPSATAPAAANSGAQLTALLAQLEPATAAFVHATDAYNAALAHVMAGNIDAEELQSIFALPAAPTGPKARKDPMTTYREDALAKLKKDHADQAAVIDKVVADWDAYSALKGPLDDPNDLIAMLRGSGVLEFRIAAQSNKLPASEEKTYRDLLRDQGPRGGDKPYKWMIIDDPKKFAQSPADLKALDADAAAFFKRRDLIGQKYAGDYYLLMSNSPDATMTQAKPGWELKRASASSDQQGMPAVSFELNILGGQYMHQLTAQRVNQPLAIVLDGRVITAPNIQVALSSSIEVTSGNGGFSREEQDYLVRTLSAGSLKARLGDYPIKIEKIGPQLGRDNLVNGLRAGVWSFALVGGFMAVYYFFWGIVADTALVLNVLIIMAFMAATSSAFTLPGIAGIVLTIGMSVDANVLILERLREEMDKGVSLETGIRLGYDRAFATIFDSHVTTIITCIVLYYTATADIKGFALTLGVGVVSSLFTALFCTRTITTMYMTYFKPVTAKMLSTAVPAVHRMLSPNIDWVGMRYIMLTCSISLVIGSIVLVGVRYKSMLDIEFLGGTSVSFDLKQGATPLSVEEVRERLIKGAANRNLPAQAQTEISQANVVTLGNAEVVNGQARARSFFIETLDKDADQVSDVVTATFADLLDVELPLKFNGMDAKTLSDAPMYRIVNADLGQDVNLPNVKNIGVAPYLGGVAILLDNINPPATTAQIADRIKRIQLQASHEQIGSRPFEVKGVSLAGGSAQENDPAKQLYSQVVVVARDRGTNYITDPQSFSEDPEGLAGTEWNLVRDAMTHKSSLTSVNNVSSSVSQTMQQHAIVALALSLLAVTIYVWFRFGKVSYGVGAIVALFHDVGIALGACAVAHYFYDTPVGRAMLLGDFKINLSLIAALLTIVGYSLNDTIVVFDRIRENKGKAPYATGPIINDAINQTISRTILTSGTTFISAMVLYVVGGEGVHGFAFAMVIGVVVGTYSSIAIASPILLIHRQLTGGSPDPDKSTAIQSNTASVR